MLGILIGITILIPKHITLDGEIIQISPGVIMQMHLETLTTRQDQLNNLVFRLKIKEIKFLKQILKRHLLKVCLNPLWVNGNFHE